VIFMSNIERLKLELANRQYLEDEQYTVLLDENGLAAMVEYEAANRRALLSTVLDILEILANDIDLFRRVETEFTTTSAAYDALSARILKVKNKIAKIDKEDGQMNDSPFSFLYIGGW